MVLIAKAERNDLQQIAKISAKIALTGLSGDAPVEGGFLVSAYSADDYSHYFNNPHTTIITAKNEKSKVIGFCLYYEKAVITADDPAQELNYMARKALEEKWGSGVNMAVIKQVAAIPEARGKGVGRLLYEYVFEDLKKRGIEFVFAAVVSDGEEADNNPLIKEKIINRASERFHEKMGFKTVISGFLYSAESKNPASAPSGIHYRKLYGKSLNRDKTLPPL